MLIYHRVRVILTRFIRRAKDAEHDILYKAKSSGEAKDSIGPRLSGLP